MESKYVHRYANWRTVLWMVDQPSLYRAPDLPEPAIAMVRRFLEKPDGSASDLLESVIRCLGVMVVVERGHVSCFWVDRGIRTIVLSSDCPLVALHELSHALHGPSEAVADAWSIRALRRASLTLEWRLRNGRIVLPTTP